MSNLLLIDSGVRDVDFVVSCLAEHTEYIIFHFETDTFETIRAQIRKQYVNVGIFQHYNTYIDTVNTYYVAPEAPQTKLGEEVLYDPSENHYVSQNGDIYYFSQIVTKRTEHKKWRMLASSQECVLDDNDYSSWGEFAKFLEYLKSNNAQNVDLMACNLWDDDNWKSAIRHFSQTSVHIRASSNNTGNDGDFVLESDDFSMIGVYFTPEILKYSYSLANEYTLSQTTSGTLPYVNENPIATSNNGVLVGTQWGANIYYSTNDGSTWNTVTNGGNGWWVATSANGNYILSTGSFSNVLLNNNVGSPLNYARRFITVTSNGNGYTCSIDDTGRFMVYGTNTGAVYYSSNFGANWSLIRNYGSGAITATLTRDGKKIISHAWDSNTVFLYDLVAANYGTSGTWTSFSVSPATSRRFCANADGSIVYISLSTSRILKVANIFGTPTQTSITTSAVPYMIVCSANGRIVAYTLSAASTIYVSLDEGATFSTYSASTTIRSLGINSAGSYIYGCNNSGTIFAKLTYNTASSMTINNGFFTSPALASNSYNNYTSSLASITGWTITSNSFNVGIANSSVAFGFPTLPAGITQWLYAQFNGNGLTTLMQNITFTNRGTYRLSYYASYRPSTEINNSLTVSSFISDVSSGQIVLSNSTWTNKVVDFTIPQTGTYPLYFYLANNLKGPIIHYPFNTNLFNIGSATSAVGSAIGGASVSNSVFISGTGSLSLNAASSQGFNIGNFSVSTTGLTICCWFRTAETTNYKRIFNFGTSSGSINNWIQLTINNANNQLTYEMYNGSTNIVRFTMGATSTYANNSWYHVAFTASIGTTTTTYKAFVNGTNTLTSTNAVAPPVTTYTFPFLGCLDGTSAFTTMHIDDFRIYDRPLSSSEIMNIYNLTAMDSTIYLSGISLSYVNSNNSVAGAPNAPTITSIVPANQQLTVNFSDATSGAYFTSYKYSVNGGSFTTLATTVSPFVITGLTNGTSYTINMRASNTVGDSANSTNVSATPYTVPETPTLNSVVAGNQQITVNFSAPSSNGGSAITNYVYSLNGGTDVLMNTTVSPFVITGLTNGTSYSVSIKAVNAAGSSASYSNALSVTLILNPTAPTLNNIISGNTQLILYFSAPSNSGGSSITNYLYSLNGGGDVQMNTTTSPFVISGLTNGVSYSIKIKAVNSFGSSVYSNTLSATPFSLPSTPVITSVSIEPKTLIVSFSSNTYGAPLTDIQYSVNGQSFVVINQSFSPICITNLTEGQAYTVSVKVSNTEGTTLASTAFSTYLPYTYQTTIPSAISLNNGVYTLTLTDASGVNSYKYSNDGVYWSSAQMPILDTTVQNGVAWRGGNYSASGSSRISFTIRGNNMNANKLSSSVSEIYNVNRGGVAPRSTLAIPTEIATMAGILMFPHNSV